MNCKNINNGKRFLQRCPSIRVKNSDNNILVNIFFFHFPSFERHCDLTVAAVVVADGGVGVEVVDDCPAVVTISRPASHFQSHANQIADF